MDLERCLILLATPKKGRGNRKTSTPLHVFEKVESLDGKDLKVLSGRYGPYVTDGETNASLPKTIEDPTKLTLEEALNLLADRRAKGPAKKRPVRKKKAAAKKKAPKKKAAKKKSG